MAANHILCFIGFTLIVFCVITHIDSAVVPVDSPSTNTVLKSNKSVRLSPRLMKFLQLLKDYIIPKKKVKLNTPSAAPIPAVPQPPPAALVAAPILDPAKVQNAQPYARPVVPPASPVSPVHPTDPVATQPIGPSAAQPITPVVVQPIPPAAAQPISPVVVQPIPPAAAQPISPVVVQPIPPAAAQPIAHVVVQPTAPAAAQPIAHVVVQSQTPAAAQPIAPAVVQPAAPVVVQPQIPAAAPPVVKVNPVPVQITPSVASPAAVAHFPAQPVTPVETVPAAATPPAEVPAAVAPAASPTEVTVAPPAEAPAPLPETTAAPPAETTTPFEPPGPECSVQSECETGCCYTMKGEVLWDHLVTEGSSKIGYCVRKVTTSPGTGCDNFFCPCEAGQKCLSVPDSKTKLPSGYEPGEGMVISDSKCYTPIQVVKIKKWLNQLSTMVDYCRIDNNCPLYTPQ